jgi:hypothetical protein
MSLFIERIQAEARRCGADQLFTRRVESILKSRYCQNQNSFEAALIWIGRTLFSSESMHRIKS